MYKEDYVTFLQKRDRSIRIWHFRQFVLKLNQQSLSVFTIIELLPLMPHKFVVSKLNEIPVDNIHNEILKISM